MKTHHAIVFIIIALVFIVLCLASCKCPEYIAGQDTEKIVEVHHRDTTIITQADSATLTALLECDSAYNVVVKELSTKQGEYIVVNALTSNKGSILQMVVDCKQDSLEHIIHLQDSVIKTHTTQTVIKEVEVKGFVYYCGWVLISIVCLLALLGIARIVLKFV